jgi:hypothetical protein
MEKTVVTLTSVKATHANMMALVFRNRMDTCVFAQENMVAAIVNTTYQQFHREPPLFQLIQQLKLTQL